MLLENWLKFLEKKISANLLYFALFDNYRKEFYTRNKNDDNEMSSLPLFPVSSMDIDPNDKICFFLYYIKFFMIRDLLCL
jgi:hypothetical protein